MSEKQTDELLEYLKSVNELEVDHAFTVYLEPERKMPWDITKKIRKSGYKIQDIYNGKSQTKITLVKDD